MKIPHAKFPGVLLAALMTVCPGAADEPVESELKAIREELQALRRDLAEQGEMIRTLYEFADSQIDFERKKKERQEEERLLLEPAVDIQDANLTSLGCCNPALPEIAVITGDGGVRIYDMAGQIVRHLKRPGDVIAAASYSSDGKMLLVGTKAGAVAAWNFSAGEWIAAANQVADTVGHTNWVVSPAFSPDGRLLISGAGDSTARIRSCESGKELGRTRVPGSSTYVESVGFFPHGEMAFALAKGRLVLAPSP